MDYKELIERLRYIVEYGDEDPAEYCTNNCGRCALCDNAADAIETLLAERDAAVEELGRIAEFTESEFLGYLNNTIHRECGYEYYCQLFDLLCQVTHWEYDDKWNRHKKGEPHEE